MARQTNHTTRHTHNNITEDKLHTGIISMRIRIFVYMLTIIMSAWPCGVESQNTVQWVTNSSAPHKVSNGLQGRHLSIWPSHGRYYNAKTGMWEWQRPQIFCTTEDLLSHSIVVPYLLPMLENAGANVFVPRERDIQREEYLVDNDLAMSGFMEIAGGEAWSKAPRAGYAISKGIYHDGERPFSKGTARIIRSTQGQNISKAFYRPNIRVGGRYAVYVSYQTVEGSVDDAEYTVVHQGQSTRFRVNQRMGSGTWVYLGTFEFDSNSTYSNYVMVSNHSSRRGFVTTDAVRFGGGMGSHERGGRTSGMPRALEASRYWAQYAGAPRAVVVSKGGHDDYGDDVNTRSLMSNWLSYGSVTNPTEDNKGGVSASDTITLSEAVAKAYLDSIKASGADSITLAQADSVAGAIADSVARIPFQHINAVNGKTMTGRVPIDLQIGLHTDAGWSRDFTTPYGTLAICTSQFNSNRLAAGSSRKQSFDLACDLLYNVSRDLKKRFGEWVTREVWDRNYSETRLPAQPSAILEMLSHENFPDMRLAHDPFFKFSLARSIYITILKYLARVDGKKAVVQPLAPIKFQARSLRANVLTLSWSPQDDEYEPTARPTSYNIYTRIGERGYDNGRSVKSTEFRLALQANKIYRFRVTAVNSGGESFPTEELVALYNPEAKQTVMIINAFHRLSSPTVIETDSTCGFDIVDDIGLSYGTTAAWVGRQIVFDKSKAGQHNGLGYSDTSLLGRYVAGNDFNYAYTHADAISRAGRYNIVSMSSEAADSALSLSQYPMLDIIIGNEKADGHSLRPYKAFSKTLQSVISDYQSKGGGVFASGSFIASDMQHDSDSLWLAQSLNIRGGGVDRIMQPLDNSTEGDTIYFGTDPVEVYRHINANHYASVASDILMPSDSTNSIQGGIQGGEAAAARDSRQWTYATGQPASAFYDDGKNRVYALGFPFECIKGQEARRRVMADIMNRIVRR